MRGAPDVLSSNRLLSSLSTSDFDLLAPHLEAVTLGLRKMLETPNKTIEAVYFPESGFASVVAVQRNGKEVEVGLIGREGMTGLPIVLGNHRSPHATYIQVARKGPLHSRERVAPGDAGEPVPSRLPVEVRSGVRRANNPHRDLQRAVQNGRAACPLAPHGAGPNPERRPAAHPRISIAHAWRAPPGRDGRAEGACGNKA